jgi:alkylhydroperoxidase family enzyme
VFVPFNSLRNRRAKYPEYRLLRIPILACLMFLALAMTPPAANRMSPSGAHGSTTVSEDVPAGDSLRSRDRGEELRVERPMLRIPDSAEAWNYLPALEEGRREGLPVWARAMARTLPHTTSALLELDHLHRARSPLEPILRGRLRWVAAHANGCRYSEVHAAADLRRAGVDEAEIQKLAGDLSSLPPTTRATLRFADKLSRDGNSVTDAEVEQLVSLHGQRQTVAIVLLLAYASFQDRMILALGLALEEDGPLPPLEVRFARLPLGASRAAAPRPQPRVEPAASREDLPPWSLSRPDDAGRIPELLAEQRSRRCRIALPDANPETPRWGLVCRTYQPELTDAWAACTRAFGDEANQDPLFEQLVFWLVTHDIGCFY